jgi:outer membrane protein assembly factor BamD
LSDSLTEYRTIDTKQSVWNVQRGSEMFIRHFPIVVTAVLALFLAGCPSIWPTDDPEKKLTAEELYKDAEARFKDKEYAAAAELFERLKSAYPEFEKIPEVYLKIGDSYFEDGKYEKAASSYLHFAELYPGNKDLPRANYQVAMCYFRQIKNIDLDSRAIIQSAKRFKMVKDNPDGGEWAKKASEKYDECMKKLAAKELYKARTYISKGNYKSARLAAKRVLEEYGKLGLDEEAEDLIKSIKGK